LNYGGNRGVILPMLTWCVPMPRGVPVNREEW